MKVFHLYGGLAPPVLLDDLRHHVDGYRYTGIPNPLIVHI